jgi:transcriptional regulator with XRE-family HTH domain
MFALIGVIVSEQSIKSVLSERLRLVREQQNLSQHELARLCDFGPNQISRIEIGISEPLASNVAKLASVLNVSIDYLMGLTDEPRGVTVASDLNAHERELLETFRAEGWAGVLHLGVDRLAK